MPADREPETCAIPLLAERLDFSTRLVTTGVVKVATVTTQHDADVDVLLKAEGAEIERVEIGRMIDAIPPVRQEGDTTIVPVVEEVLVVERRLRLKEEVRIRRVHTRQRHRETVTLRRQEATIMRTTSNPNEEKNAE